jgi:hypothetical protein
MLRTGHQIYNTSDSRSHPSPSTYKWDENSIQLFQNALSSTRIDELIINFNENNYINIDSMVNDLNCIIMEAANMSLKLKSPRKTRNSKILNKKKTTQVV